MSHTVTSCYIILMVDNTDSDPCEIFLIHVACAVAGLGPSGPSGPSPTRQGFQGNEVILVASTLSWVLAAWSHSQQVPSFGATARNDTLKAMAQLSSLFVV